MVGQPLLYAIAKMIGKADFFIIVYDTPTFFT